jgi:DNA polymerase zeta
MVTSPIPSSNVNHISLVSPNGIMYVKPCVRKGLLSRMLVELLDTRVMVKQAMKRVGGDKVGFEYVVRIRSYKDTFFKVRKRILDARQLSLKYIANVTYGYTGATFSGRMPAVEIADSIVQSGRETLEKVKKQPSVEAQNRTLTPY